MKLLHWDSDGYAIWHKRLEAGRYRVARVDESEEITAVDLQALLGGTELLEHHKNNPLVSKAKSYFFLVQDVMRSIKN